MDTPFEFDGPTGMVDPKVDLFAEGNDTPVTLDIAVTEATNRKMTYGGVISAAVEGKHKIHIKDGSDYIGVLTCDSLMDTDVLQFFKEGIDLSDVPGYVEVGLIIIDVLSNEDLVAGVPVAEALRRIGGVTAGELQDAQSGVETVRDWANSAKTMVCTVDELGNRSSWVYN